MPKKPARQTRTALLLDPEVKKHLTGPGHPERPERYLAIERELEKAGLVAKLESLASRTVTDEEAKLCHSGEYLDLLQAEVSAADGLTSLSTGDTTICAQSLDVARRASGGVLNAVDFACAEPGEKSETRRNAFCAVRPPGHHASAAVGMGFCLLNHVAIAARYAQGRHGIGRVAIIDWDVHHGNGTQNIFYSDDSVFYFSTHQSPLYPHTGAANETGEGKGLGHTMNCPLPAGSSMEQVGAAFDRQFLPRMEEFKPELVLISAGFDSRIGDPLGAFQLTDDDFVSLTERLLDLADRHAGGRLVSVLEGGYNVDGLAAAVVAHTKSLTS